MLFLKRLDLKSRRPKGLRSRLRVCPSSLMPSYPLPRSLWSVNISTIGRCSSWVWSLIGEDGSRGRVCCESCGRHSVADGRQISSCWPFAFSWLWMRFSLSVSMSDLWQVQSHRPKVLLPVPPWIVVTGSGSGVAPRRAVSLVAYGGVAWRDYG